MDRPASAVKELLENAIDSGARHITLEIQRGGVAFIRVADDGCGIEKDDLAPAIKRHSTSKIKTAEDLDSITTLGFRGEALAAISSVSRLRIYSKVPGAEMGALLEADGGRIKDITDTGMQGGNYSHCRGFILQCSGKAKIPQKRLDRGCGYRRSSRKNRAVPP